VRREFTILREEIAAAVLRWAPAYIPGPSMESRRGEAERALEVLTQFVAVAERLSLESHRRQSSASRTLEAPSGYRTMAAVNRWSRAYRSRNSLDSVPGAYST
jgi:hypothetical protein